METMIDEAIKTENMETTTFEESERLAREQIEADYAAYKEAAVQDTAQEEIVQTPQEEIVQNDVIQKEAAPEESITDSNPEALEDVIQKYIAPEAREEATQEYIAPEAFEEVVQEHIAPEECEEVTREETPKAPKDEVPFLVLRGYSMPESCAKCRLKACIPLAMLVPDREYTVVDMYRMLEENTESRRDDCPLTTL